MLALPRSKTNQHGDEAELVVLPETATTGFSPGVDAERLWDLVAEVPGPLTEPIQEATRRLGVHAVLGTYERGPSRGEVYNTAVLVALYESARLGKPVTL